MKDLEAFKETVWTHYNTHKRQMPWRVDTSPYSIVVSEIMLQQTQVSRVVRKYESWMKRFPTWQALAKASTKEVLQEWSGLGYNRRGLYLKRIAEQITNNGTAKGVLLALRSSELAKSEVGSSTFDELRELPGIGPNTAGSILAFAFNIPRPFIETNIRSVFIHHFFNGTNKKVEDKKLMPFIEATLDQKNPREWYWALMDYGSHLKSINENPSRKSKHHVKQTPFKGSNREVRSRILKAIMREPATQSVIAKNVGMPLKNNLEALTKEGFIVKKGNLYQIV